MEINKSLWYVITAVGGQEESIAQSIREKMNNYHYSNFVNPLTNDPSANIVDENTPGGIAPAVNEVRVFMKNDYDEQVFSKTSPDLPKNLKNTKTVRWEALPDGRYKRIKSKRVNRFPSYIFVRTTLTPEIWYAIRNTVGVMGFVGSTGKGAMPVPCWIHEYEKIIKEQITREYAARIVNAAEKQQEQEKKQEAPVLTEAPFKVGQHVFFASGSLQDCECVVKDINLKKQTAKVEYEIFAGNPNEEEVPFGDLKLAK